MVEIKRKVTLKTKQSQETNSSKPSPDNRSSNKGLITIVVVLVLLLGGYFLYKSISGDNKETTVSNPVETVAPEGTPTDGAVDEPSTPASDDVAEPSDIPAVADTEVPESPAEETPAAKEAVDAPVTTDTSSTGGTSNAKPSGATTATIDGNASVDEIAKDVIRGLYGNGSVRKSNLGARYSEIQQRVNELYQKGLVY